MKKFVATILVFACSVGLIACNKTSSDLKADDPEQHKVEIKENKYKGAGIDNPVEFEKMFNTVKELVAAGKKEEVANYVIYPLRVNCDQEKIMIKTKEDFIKNYDEIFTDKIKTALENQKVEDLFVNYQGVMVGNGEIWFDGNGIITINR